MLNKSMKKLCLIVVLLFAFSTTVQAGSNTLDLETWFELKNRGQIQNLHSQMTSMNEEDLGGWDYTTIWDVRHSNYEFEGFRVMRVLTDSMDKSWIGCCYTDAAGLVLEIQSNVDLSKIAAKYNCDINDESIAINGLHFHNHSITGRSYVEMRCSTL